MSRARVLVVFGHGREQSLGHRLLATVQDELERRDAETRVHDLLGDGFDPVLRLPTGVEHAGRSGVGEDPVAHRYQEDVVWAERYVILHPVWWFAPPAILKGWVDRILVHDVALTQHDSGPPTPLLGGRKALLVQTFNATRTIDSVMFRGITGAFWRRAVLPSVGIQDVQRLALYSVPEQGAEGLARFEEKLRKRVAALVAG